MTTPDLGLIPAGAAFAASDFVYFSGREVRSLDEVLADVDIVMTGPHATAAWPAEIAAFADDRLTRRLQYDFSDCSTSPIAKRIAALDSGVLYIENPHPRALRDPNRPRPADIGATLREAYARTRAADGATPALGGVDAIRPVTFGALPVFREPTDEAAWQRLIGTLADVASRGLDVYERTRDELLERVVDAKLRRLVTLDPATTTVADWRRATTVIFLAFHDTMNTKARPDGAITVERAPEDRLPDIVALSNRGDADGEARPSDDGRPLAAGDVPTIAPATARALAAAHRRAFDVADADDVALNRPYLGSYEIQHCGPMLAELSPRAIAAHPGGGTVRLDLGAVQAEFRRETLLGDETAAALQRPGDDWPDIPADHVDHIARRMIAAFDIYRTWGRSLQGGARPRP